MARHSCALRADGTVWCWGTNLSGQLGDGGWEDGAFEVGDLGGEVAMVAAGGDSSCAVVSGELFCWGDNTWGAVGDAAMVGDVGRLRVQADEDPAQPFLAFHLRQLVLVLAEPLVQRHRRGPAQGAVEVTV